MQPICGISRVVPNSVRVSPSTCAGMKIHVASESQIKSKAALQAIQNMFKTKVKPVVQGYPAASEVKEEPHGIKMTVEGAENRIRNLHKLVLEQDPTDPATANDNIARFYLSFENGVIEEDLEKVDQDFLFRTKNDKVWVDRCYIICEVFYNTKHMTVEGFSDGVPVPFEHVEESEKSGWNKIVGDFIAERYQTDPKNWHTVLSGVSREELMRKALENILANTVKIFV